MRTNLGVITIALHSLNVTYNTELSNYLSKAYHEHLKVKDQSTKMNQTLLDLFSHS